MGCALSFDGSILYVTIEIIMKSSNSQQLGGLIIIDVPTWATDLVETPLGIVHPGCEPARVAIMPGDETVWDCKVEQQSSRS